MRHLLCLLSLAGLCALSSQALAQSADLTQSDSRQLRRLTLSLTDREPTYEEYQTLLAKPVEQRQGFLTAHAQALMNSPAFLDVLRVWGKDYLRTGQFFLSERWTEHLGVQIAPCDVNTLHAGAYTWWYGGDAMCDDATLSVRAVSPWWAPDQSIPVVGPLGDGTTTLTKDAKLIDCGATNGNRGYNVIPIDNDCSCGPALIYCARAQQGGPTADADRYDPVHQNRAAIDEPSRLFEHIVTNERPFSDLVLGDYTVVNQGLYHMYLREGRLQFALAGDTQAADGFQATREVLDMSTWWRAFGDPGEWREVKLSAMNPVYLDARDTKHDPRLTTAPPQGVPSAGVLTTLVAHASFPRERVRAARWLEVLTCREFTPPDASVSFPRFTLDPATGGNCIHCHKAIDPAAIHFKRFYSGASLRTTYGIANATLTPDAIPDRIRASFDPGTMLTPITQQDMMANPNALLLDFLPPEQTLLGQQSDGTIGPLGFAKMVVASGQFDQCAVRRAFARFGGYYPKLGRDQVLIDELVTRFVSEGRNMKTLIAHIVTRPDSKRGM